VEAREGSLPVQGHVGNQQHPTLIALTHKHVAREKEKAAEQALKRKKLLLTEEQAGNAQAIFEFRRLHGLPPVAPGELAMTDGDRHAIALRREQRGLLGLPSDGSSSSSSSSSSSRSGSRQVPSTAALWDSQSVRETLELAKAMEDATSAADFADTARQAAANAIDARVQERTHAEAAAQAPERAENGPGEGSAPQPLGAEDLLRPGEPQEDLYVS